MPKVSKQMRHIHNIHLIGIGGSGMSGIAEVLHNLGYKVSGSDTKASSVIDNLVKRGIQVYLSHAAAQVEGKDVVVVSSAIKPDNVECTHAESLRIPLVPRAQMLAELMRLKYGIAIAGTHGKTTTTSLIASLMTDAGLDPTFVIGGCLNSLGSNANLGKGHYFVAEADESDASFLMLNPIISVVTNIDHDHLETYNNDFEQLKNAYVQFLQLLPFYGMAIICLDDSTLCDIMPRVHKPWRGYGFGPEADYQALNYHQEGCLAHFDLKQPHTDQLTPFVLNLSGRHNVLNALAAIAVGIEEGLPVKVLQQSLANFQGINRRFQILGQIDFDGRKALVIDDYGHHPTEIKAVFAAIRQAWPKRRMLVVFQPHRFSRTKVLFDAFAAVLSSADVLLLMEVYAANETPIQGINSTALAHNIRSRTKLDPIVGITQDNIIEILDNVLKDDDIVLMQGAGNIGRLAKQMLQQCLA